jgi:hypothetical protein
MKGPFKGTLKREQKVKREKRKLYSWVGLGSFKVFLS